MTFEQLIFGLTFVVALGSSFAMLFMRNAVHVALYLVAAQIALALAFLLQGAFFIAAVQIIIYAGAIMVLFLFVIMLLGVDRRDALVEPLPAQRPLAAFLGTALVAEILYISAKGVELIQDVGERTGALDAINRDPGNVKAIARVLFGPYLLPFEATSILLVVAIVGVMVLARRMTSLSERTEAPAPTKEAA
jgi:NADH-quinone oxidoreductase subunit J